MSSEHPHPTHSPEQRLREYIDSGRTGDKVDASDPAAVPLGTDAEAAGTPTDPGAVLRARQNEPAGVETPRRPERRYMLILPGFVLVVAALLAIVLLR